MKNFIRKSVYIGVVLFVVSFVISCEEDFTDIESGVISNTKFSTGEVVLDLEISSINIESIIADNIGLPVLQNNSRPQVDYWLGVYKKENAKNLEAGFVSQISLPSILKTSEDVIDGDTIYNLDQVVLKIPYTAVSLGANSEGITTYRLDSILGNTAVATAIEVYQNPTFLSVLNPANPAKINSYPSNFDYQETELLSAADFSFTPSATDTIFEFDRIDRSVDVNNTSTVKDTLKVMGAANVPVPFLAIPLDLNKMKTTFWDKFNEAEFSSSDAFQDYFRGVILKAKGSDGALVPFNLSSNSEASIDFLYSKTILKDAVVDTIIKEDYSFSLTGIQNNMYKTDNIIPQPTNSFVVQGTAGLSAEIKILGVNLANLDSEDPFLVYANKDVDNNNYLDLEELASIKDVGNNEFGFLINDADLTFVVNSALSSNADVLPQRLYVYQNKDNGNGGVTPTHVSDSYEEGASFNGNLFTNDADVPEDYTFKITDYISDIMDRSSDDFSPLVLKVFNVTDNPVITGFLNQNVLQYNWNPRSVVLFNENGDKKARLKISYTKKLN
ncbi:DUF4270 family protein [uncultured Polaribacter sp.]|uniref:DUF4270 family protein n=1 Tax=uncultured Polaribacter sp. TaxID=174711 RepID=UPI002602590F|nr:DUF4270 family protein [uncultured Polaribacter sp.]